MLATPSKGPSIVNVPSSVATLIIGIAITLISLWVGQNNGLLPTAASVEAAQIDNLFNAMMAIATGLFLLVQGALLYSLFAFRKKKDDDTDAAPVHGNVPLEIVWTAIPSAIVLWLAIYSFDVYQSVNSGGFMGSDHMAHAQSKIVNVSNQTQMADMGSGMSNPIDNSLVINVKGLQYAWLFYYDGTDIVSGDLHVPSGRPVELNINAQDVIHAFWVPEFRLKQDAVPGVETHLAFTPNKPGNYPIICAELCGAYHGAMKTRVIVDTPEDYETWYSSRVVATTDSSSEVAATSNADHQMASLTPEPDALTDLQAENPSVDSQQIQALLSSAEPLTAPNL
ncbi:Cytochrome c oxidase subunit 2 [Acaryochloris thomasi RCC1774]|uniref:Cytochrome c oxidase subunit 2 n=1 Tax=Acaryochloris thomasi RCC1774 TaxID=1764569 RepID=A0A2W1JLF4_9CYAN|nr:Cytochrome c oxidase subunit 2 [Acaryochloris thomasi RCC1774]